MAFFYGVHIQEPELASALSLIRFLGEPDFFRPTHITIRGPYTRKIDETIEDIEKKFGAKKRFVELVGIGTFFEGNQNTVFLTCVIPDVEEIWKKPDYQGVKPHLTLYDGKSRHFAYKLKAALEKFSWHIKAEVSNLRRIESKQKPTEYLDIYFEVFSPCARAPSCRWFG